MKTIDAQDLTLMSVEDFHDIQRNDFAAFVDRSFSELNSHVVYMPGQYIELICSRLEDCRTGKIKQLIINLPPRTSKSHIASVCFPAWMLGHDPTKQIICASYGQDLADKLARIAGPLWRIPSTRPCSLPPSSPSSSIGEFMTSRLRIQISTPIGGVLRGRGAEFIILDDVMKPDEALSQPQRNKVIHWYRDSVLSRLNSKANGVVIIVMQRL